VTVVKLGPVMLAQRLGIDADNTGNLRFRHPISGHRLHLAAGRRIGPMRLPSHQETFPATSLGHRPFTGAKG
jgi:hypothetical protein